MKALIHQTPEERLATNSDTTVLEVSKLSPKLDKVTQAVESFNQGNQKKLDEVKSASLITNKLLKDIRDKKEPPIAIIQKVALEGISVLTLKGDKGDSVQGPKGEKGDSIVGPKGDKGDSKIGPKGDKGDSVKGDKGIDGKDGSPDTPDEVVTKIHQATKLIHPSRIAGLEQLHRDFEKYGTNPMGIGGGANALIMQDSTGAQLSAYITTLKFGSGVTPTYANGVVTITASGSATTVRTETPTGTIDGVNKTYTTSATITTVIGIWTNGQYIHPSEYTPSGAGFTMGTALDSSLSGLGFTISFV